MYTVTFYSYKGGVGRTMALVNVAYMLAKAGKRVLLVDFDLEAPGLSSYDGLSAGQDRAGIVEYVRRFQLEGRSPDVAEFLAPCDIDGMRLWIMPAGRHRTAEYATEFNSISWRQLYDEEDGFLLMEDLKQQWAEFEGRGFDYVLIDSRTGHTDVGGICTRQLPDAVVILFVPTNQNIDGLVPIVKTIRSEAAPVRERPARLHFCPSNVPASAEQEKILNDRLEDAAKRLEYGEPATVIQHFDSFELLELPIFARRHAGSRLVKQLDQLRSAIMKENIEDRDGALLALQDLPQRFREAQAAINRSDLDDINAITQQIRALYPNDGDIAWGLAAVANAMMRPDEELAALDVAIANGSHLTRALLRRAFLRSSVDGRGIAFDDLSRLVGAERPTVFELMPALDLARSLDPQRLPDLLRFGFANPRVDGFGKGEILLRMLTEGSDLEEISSEAAAAYRFVSSPDTPPLRNSLALVLIALGDFQGAMKLFPAGRQGALESAPVHEVFNFMVAEWGATGRCPNDLAKQVLVRRSEMRRSFDANGLQCFAICNDAIGNRDAAAADLEAAVSKAVASDMAFDCWRWRYVSGDVMLADLTEMRRLVENGGRLVPSFLTQARSTAA